METAEVIRNRRSVREFAGDPVSADELDQLLEAARWAPPGSTTSRGGSCA